MNMMNRRVWRGATTRVACCAVALAVSATVAAGASARDARTAATAKCTPSQTQVWLGLGLGGGTAGSTYYPLEFSNVGHSACTLSGFPGVSAIGNGGGQVGPAAGRSGKSHGTVTLAPNATIHAILRVADWGALCSTKVDAAGLKVYPPGESRAFPIVPFPFGACAHQGVLTVEAVKAGVGIPGYTTS